MKPNMGNCLDIPPPPPPKGRSAYMSRPRYFVVRRGLPGVSAAMLRDYPAYQPYAVFGGFRPPMTPHSITEPFYTYGFDPASAMPAYYDDSGYLTHSSRGYDEHTISRGSRYKKHRRTREKRPRHGGSVDGDNQKLSNGTAGTENGVISAANMKNVKATRIPGSAGTAALMSSHKEGDSNVEQDPDILLEVASTSVVTQGNTEVQPVRKTSSTSDSEIEEIIIDDPPGVVKVTNKVEAVKDSPEGDEVNAFLESDTILENSLQRDLEQHGTRTSVSHDDTSVFREDTSVFHDGISVSHDDTSVFHDDISVYHNDNSASRDDISVFASTNSPDNMDPLKQSTYSPCDVVICHHSADSNVMLKIKQKFENSGLTVAVSYPTGDKGFVDWLMFPQAVVDARIMVVLLSENSVRDKHTADEVCLGYVTDTIIYPVTLGKSLDLDSAMDACLKLQLSCYKWTQLADDGNPDFAIAMMTRSVKEDLDSLKTSDVGAQSEMSHRAHAHRNISRHRHVQQKKVTFGGHVTAAQYWEKPYGNDTDSVPWDKLYEDLYKNYRSQWKDIVPQTSVVSLRESLRHEMKVGTDETVHKAHFLEFCNKLDSGQDVWERIHCLAIETQAVASVLDVESTVRIVAIENIAKFGSQKAMNALRSLLTDNDPSIRAVATMSLSRSMMEGDQATFTALLATLDDKNELVRETGCLALSRLRATAAVDKLRTVCNNDAVSQVRDAAAVALKEIEGN